MVSTNNAHPTKPPSPDGATTDKRARRDAGPPEARKDSVQGEGNYEAARQFNDAERKFVAAGKVAAAARAAAPKSEAEQQEMIAAEQEGKRRAKEEDPALKPMKPSAP